MLRRRLGAFLFFPKPCDQTFGPAEPFLEWGGGVGRLWCWEVNLLPTPPQPCRPPQSQLCSLQRKAGGASRRGSAPQPMTPLNMAPCQLCPSWGRGVVSEGGQGAAGGRRVCAPQKSKTPARPSLPHVPGWPFLTRRFQVTSWADAALSKQAGSQRGGWWGQAECSPKLHEGAASCQLPVLLRGSSSTPKEHSEQLSSLSGSEELVPGATNLSLLSSPPPDHLAPLLTMLGGRGLLEHRFVEISEGPAEILEVDF